MKKILTGLCMALLLVCVGCGEQNENAAVIPTKKPTVTEEPVPTVGPMDANEQEYKGYVEKQNVTIEGRNYSYIKYRINPDSIRLISLKTKDKVLVIPYQIDDKPVTVLGGEPAEILGMPKQGEIEKKMIGKYAWLTDEKQVLEKIVVPEGVEELRALSFRCVRAKEVELPKSLKRIGEFAFAQSNLKSIDFPNGFQGEIESDCFSETQLEFFELPCANGTKKAKVGSYAFRWCKKLREVSFPNNQKHIYIAENTFLGCSALESLVFPASTGKVTYENCTYADNYQHSVGELVFLGKDTEVKGGKYYGKDNKNSITVGKIVAPQNSKAIEFAEKALKIEKLTKNYQEYGESYGMVPDGMFKEEQDVFAPLEYEET